MRYLNWDILLFPGSSRIPLQEFDTKCHVLPDTDSHRIIDNTASVSDPYVGGIEPLSHTPVLTSFVSSLEQGSPFRVSIHSWDAPKASQILRTFKTKGESIAFEARVYLDGNMAAHRIFNEQVMWPEVIDSAGDTDTTHPKPLRFPAFHSEILEQAHWEAGETHGRIRIVIAEGVVAPAVEGRTRSSFDRLRDVVAFSFQHAPRHILEYSGIAWPSARMFRRAARANNGNPASRTTVMADFETHAHSPTKRFGSNTTAILVSSNQQVPEFEDPFLGPAPISLRHKGSKLQNASNDGHTKDYSSVRTARSHAGTDMSGVSYQKPNFERAMNEAAIDEIVRALTPERRQELYRALSPEKRIDVGGQADGDNGLAPSDLVGPLEKRFGLCDESEAFMKAHGYNSPSELYRSLLTMRSSSVPPATPFHTDAEIRKLSQGLGNSMNPPLPLWDMYERPEDQSVAPMELRPRSTSNASKRKRQESPRVSISTEHCTVSTMSTPPFKQDNTPSTSLGKRSMLC